MAIHDTRRVHTLGFVYGIAVAGTAVHDIVEFGHPSPQNTLPVAVILGPLLWTSRRTGKRPYALIVVLTIIFVAGAVASVLPLALWPFDPEQSGIHYLVHVVWALSLVPAIVVATHAATDSPSTT